MQHGPQTSTQTLPQIGMRVPTLEPKKWFPEDVWIKAKIPVAILRRKGSQKIAAREYEVHEINYSKMKDDQERARIQKIQRHRAHQERVTKSKYKKTK